MAVRRLYEPLCIAFGTTVSSPTVPTYQLYDLPHKFTPRLHMGSEDPNLVLREIGVWAGWEQAGSANTRSFLLDLLKDEGAHDNFLLQEHGPTRFRRVRGIIVLTLVQHVRRARSAEMGSPRRDGRPVSWVICGERIHGLRASLPDVLKNVRLARSVRQ